MDLRTSGNAATLCNKEHACAVEALLEGVFLKKTQSMINHY
jgi:hypothetical protein